MSSPQTSVGRTAGHAAPTVSAEHTAPHRRRRHAVWVSLCAWSIVCAAARLPTAGVSWHFFRLGATTLVSSSPGGGLHLYATHPNLQIGPLALLAAVPLSLLSGWGGEFLAIALMTVAGPLCLGLVVRHRRMAGAAVSDAMLVLVGVPVLAVWAEVAVHYAHLDDVIALALAVGALIAVEHRRPVTAGLLVALAIDAKPWAAAFTPLLLALPRERRAAACWTAISGVLLAWLPFIVVDHRSLLATRFTIPNVPSSALRSLGVRAARTPWWDRPAQLTLGLVAACLAVRRSRWPAVLLVALAVRVLLDPETYAYYTSGLVLAAAVADLLLSVRRLPILTVAAVVVVYLARALPFSPQTLGDLRALYCVGAIGYVLLADQSMLRTLTARGHGGRCAVVRHPGLTGADVTVVVEVRAFRGTPVSSVHRCCVSPSECVELFAVDDVLACPRPPREAR